MSRVAADQRPAALRHRAPDRRVDVLVRKVERSRVAEGRYEADQEAGGDDRGQHEAGGNRRNARERLRPRDGYVDSHERAIGTACLSLERVMPPNRVEPRPASRSSARTGRTDGSAGT